MFMSFLMLGNIAFVIAVFMLVRLGSQLRLARKTVVAAQEKIELAEANAELLMHYNEILDTACRKGKTVHEVDELYARIRSERSVIH